MVYGGVVLMCINFGILPRRRKNQEAREATGLKKDHPVFFALIGPITFFIGIGQILRQFHLYW